MVVLKGNYIDQGVGQLDDFQEETILCMVLLCFVYGKMNIEGEQSDDCTVYNMD